MELQYNAQIADFSEKKSLQENQKSIYAVILQFLDHMTKTIDNVAAVASN